MSLKKLFDQGKNIYLRYGDKQGFVAGVFFTSPPYNYQVKFLDGTDIFNVLDQYLTETSYDYYTVVSDDEEDLRGDPAPLLDQLALLLNQDVTIKVTDTSWTDGTVKECNSELALVTIVYKEGSIVYKVTDAEWQVTFDGKVATLSKKVKCRTVDFTVTPANLLIQVSTLLEQGYSITVDDPNKLSDGGTVLSVYSIPGDHLQVKTQNGKVVWDFILKFNAADYNLVKDHGAKTAVLVNKNPTGKVKSSNNPLQDKLAKAIKDLREGMANLCQRVSDRSTEIRCNQGHINSLRSTFPDQPKCVNETVSMIFQHMKRLEECNKVDEEALVTLQVKLAFVQESICTHTTFSHGICDVCGCDEV